MAAVLAAATLATTPLLLAALGGLVNRLGGIVNIALEGKMLLGALTAVLVASTTGTWLFGVLAAAAAGALLGLVFSWSITRLGANEIIAGLGLNVLVAGAIGYGLGGGRSLQPAGLSRMPRIEIPLIADVPLLGDVLSGKDPLTYLVWIAVPALAWVLVSTPVGLRLRATGADGRIARTLSLPAMRIRDASTVVAGAFAGLAGASLSLGLVGLFNQGMVAGRGFVALAAFYFGRSRPWPTAAACVLFAVFDALQIRVQAVGIPSQLVTALPYLVVVAALSASALEGRRRGRTARTAP